jgi:predicted nuclease of predicted toxin-antitoxin system
LKLLVDENLAPRLASHLADLFPTSIHVSFRRVGQDHRCRHLGICESTSIHTPDYREGLCEHKASPWATPKVILLTDRYCSTAILERIIRDNAIRFSDFESDTKRRLLIVKLRIAGRCRIRTWAAALLHGRPRCGI